jgi:protease YdgD
MARARHFAVAFSLAAAVAASGLSPTRSQAEERASSETRITAPLLLGLGAHDPRGRLDPDKTPWRAIGKLQVPSVSFYQSCTATLVAPTTVLTAAHCVFNPRTRRYHLPGSLHFLIGYDGSRYAGHALAIKFETGEGYDPTRPKETIGSDWTLITLDTRLGSPDRILPMIHEVPEIGSPIMLGGYQQDHPLVLMADTDCHIVGRVTDSAGRLLVRHNCTGTRGVSGAPLLIVKDGKWYIAGIDVAAELGVASGLAVDLDEPRKHL